MVGDWQFGIVLNLLGFYSCLSLWYVFIDLYLIIVVRLLLDLCCSMNLMDLISQNYK